jgi:hypothetical protein
MNKKNPKQSTDGKGLTGGEILEMNMSSDGEFNERQNTSNAVES